MNVGSLVKSLEVLDCKGSSLFNKYVHYSSARGYLIALEQVRINLLLPKEIFMRYLLAIMFIVTLGLPPVANAERKVVFVDDSTSVDQLVKVLRGAKMSTLSKGVKVRSIQWASSDNLQNRSEGQSAETNLVVANNSVSLSQSSNAQREPKKESPNVSEASQQASGSKIAARVQFVFASSSLADESKNLLNKIASALAQVDGKITVVGHTDSKGPASFNLSLSEARAEAVVGYLCQISRLERDRFVAIGKGEESLFDSAHPEDGVNRRVEIQVGQ